LAALNFNMEGYAFESGLKVLRDSYLAANIALAEAEGRACDALTSYEEDVAKTGQWIGEVDDETGCVIWDHADHLRFDIENSRLAAWAMRNAFVLAAYHHWERAALVWSGNPDARFPELVAATTRRGYSVHDRLQQVRVLANAIKHNKDHSGDRLSAAWPAVLRPGFRKHPIRTDWYDAIQLDAQTMEDVFEIVAGSGPTADTALNR